MLIDPKTLIFGDILGKGRYGTTHKAWSTNLEKYVAVKSIDISKNKKIGRSQLRLIGQEISSLIDLSEFPNCDKYISCYYGSYPDLEKRMYYIVTEFIDGITLDKYMPILRKNMSVQLLITIFFQLALAVNYIHSKMYAHRDLKPENIMIVLKDTLGDDSQKGRLKLIDFGFACFDKQCRGISGSPLWIPPEIYKNILTKTLKDYQAQDIWSLGIIFFELANEHYPLNIEVINKMKHEEFRDFLEKTPLERSKYFGSPNLETNAKINSLIDSMLNKDINLRPKSSEVLNIVAEVWNSLPEPKNLP